MEGVHWSARSHMGSCSRKYTESQQIFGLQMKNTGASCPPSNRLQGKSLKKQSHFTYRGMFIDLSRNWFPAHQSESLNYDDFLKFVVDIAAELELTHLHLHLSDDQGWRLEIPGLPELTDFGAHRCPSIRPCLFQNCNFGAHSSL